MKRLSLFVAIFAALLAVPLKAASKPDPLNAAKQIDALLAKDWAANHLKANAPAGDQVLVRRLYLDIAGRIPTARETEEFLSSKDPAKRQKLIDKLLSGEGYVQNFFNFWADVLRAETNPQGGGGVQGAAYLQFIKDSLRSNKPYDQFVRDMVGATGKTWENGAIGYYLRDRNMPLDNMATTVRIFLGTRIECAQCHNHPFDHWSQKQFYQMAAFTYGINSRDYDGGPMKGVRQLMNAHEQDLRKKIKDANGNPDPALKEEMEKARNEGRYVNEALTRARDPLRYTGITYDTKKLQLPHDYKYPDDKPYSLVAPAVMMGKAVDCPPGGGGDTLDKYADWMTAPGNPRFTKVIVNRLWKKAFGLALYEPLDELMDNSEAMVPELEKYLENFMVASGYDMKAYLKAVYNSKAYQSQATREEVPAGVVYHFTGPVLRRMSAEQMWDSFVALINPTPDMLNLAGRESDEQRMAGTKKLNDAFESLTPEEMLKGAETAALKYREQNVRLKAIQAELSEARASDDKDKVKALSQEMGELQRTALRSVNQNITIPAVLKLATTVRNKDKAEATSGDANAEPIPGASDMTMMMQGGDMATSMTKIIIPGYDRPKKTEEQLKAEKEAQLKVYQDEAQYFGIPAKELKYYFQYRAQQTRSWLRAAEIESPAPRGHYLREFGQSDREIVENSNRDASVPQALAMMNGSLLPEIEGHYSQLMLSVGRAKYPDDQVNAIYMTLLSRQPTAKEKETWLQSQDKGLNDVKDLIYALLNTQQFIFIQ